MKARHLGACVFALLLSAPASAAMVLATYTLDFKPPNPNCSSTGLGDLSSATLAGALNFATVDATGSLVTKDPGPIQLPLYAFNGGAYDVGTLTVLVQAVPLPGAIGLFGSALLGLIGLARRKAA